MLGGLHTSPPSPGPFQPGSIGPVALRNRVIKAATFEGMSPAGRVTPALVEHHRRLADGGIAMTTLAYVAISPRARTFADQIVMSDDAVPQLRALTEAVRRAGARASVQLVHGGGFSKLRGHGLPRGPSLALNPYGMASGVPVSRAMTERDITGVVVDFAAAATRARLAGFDAVEIHLGHGYLLSQFLSPATNRRRDAWGGTLARRLALPRAVVAAVREAVPDLAVLAKLNLEDGFAGGLGIDEAVEVARMLSSEGVDALVPSGGFTSRSPFHLLRGRAPIPEMVAAEKNPLQRVVLHTLGRRLIRSLPFEETFFLEQARAVLAAVDTKVALLGGVVSLANMKRAIAEGFSFVVLGRALLADPDLVLRMQRGEVDRTRCTACNACVATFDAGGVRCVLDDVTGSGR